MYYSQTPLQQAEFLARAFYDQARWVRRHIWALYVGFVTYLFFGHVGQAFGAGAAVEFVDWGLASTLVAVNWVTWIDPYLLMRRTQTTTPEIATDVERIMNHHRTLDMLFRLVAMFEGIWAAVFIAWVAGFSPTEGKLRWVAWLILMFGLIATRYNPSYSGLWATAILQTVLWVAVDVGNLFSAEPWLRGATGLFGGMIFIMAIIASFVIPLLPPPPSSKNIVPSRLIPALYILVTSVTFWVIATGIWYAVETPDAGELSRLIS